MQAGTWTEEREPPASAERLHCPLPCGPDTFVLRVAGQSMAPSVPDGDYILIDPDLPADHGSFVVVRRPADGAATFKQLVVENERRYLKAANPTGRSRSSRRTPTPRCAASSSSGDARCSATRTAKRHAAAQGQPSACDSTRTRDGNSPRSRSR